MKPGAHLATAADRWRISPAALVKLGWTPAPLPGVKGTAFNHRDGWRIEHCGHPTAIWPYMLFDPSGRMILSGAQAGKPDCGKAWDTIARAAAWVASVTGLRL